MYICNSGGGFPCNKDKYICCKYCKELKSCTKSREACINVMNGDDVTNCQQLQTVDRNYDPCNTSCTSIIQLLERIYNRLSFNSDGESHIICIEIEKHLGYNPINKKES